MKTNILLFAILIMADCTSHSQEHQKNNINKSNKKGEPMTNTKNVTDAEIKQSTEVIPFHFSFSDEEISDMRRRIEATKWPERETVNDESQGIQLDVMQKLAKYWATEYDWRKIEVKLKSLPQYTTTIDGLEIHFIHVRSKHKNALPIIITHGWPGSIIEQMKLIGPLTDPTEYGG